MNELYIIGNGFDKAHSLKTSYWDFREYLEKYHIDFLFELEKMYGIQDLSNHAHHYSKEKLCELKNSIHEMLWKEFESNIGEAEDASIIDGSTSVVDSMHLDGGPIGIEDTMDEYWENQYNFIEQLNEFVLEWIKQVDLSKVKPIVKKLKIMKMIIFSHLITQIH